MSDDELRRELVESTGEYCQTRDAHKKARERIEEAIVAAIEGGVPRTQVYELVSDALSERRTQQIAEKRGLEPGRPWGHKPKDVS